MFKGNRENRTIEELKGLVSQIEDYTPDDIGYIVDLIEEKIDELEREM